MADLYYKAPSTEIFEEVKAAAIEVWTENYPEETSPFYAKEKVDRIKDIGNVTDNLMYMVAMFDIHNQFKLAQKLSPEAREAIRERMYDGGNRREDVVF